MTREEFPQTTDRAEERSSHELQTNPSRGLAAASSTETRTRATTRNDMVTSHAP